MGNADSSGQEVSQRLFMKRNESFGSKSPRRTNKNTVTSQAERQHKGNETTIPTKLLDRGRVAKNGMVGLALQQQNQLTRYNRSHSLEQSGMHSPSSSRSSSSNSYINSVLGGVGAIGEAEKSCLRQSTEPMFNISGDLNPHQIGLVRRVWKAALKAANNAETEIATRILLRIFQLDPRNLALFSLKNVSINGLRSHPVFKGHVNTFEPTLVHVMSHLTNATTLSKHLQQLGGRHVNYTGVTYKSPYWKSFTQALIDVLTENGGNGADLRDALVALGDFCVEQMRIGYRIEHKLQCEAERLAQAQNRRRRVFMPHRDSPI
uniref:Globin family profile domain-containing protein n=1 Tax=Globodera rostochiensis TaxID=31243 RepID=A0A914HHM2_GLORO